MKKIIIYIFLIHASFAYDTFDINIGACNLAITKPYELKSFSPNYNFRFSRLEDKTIGEFMGANFFYTHKIVISDNNLNKTDKQKLINKLKKIYPLKKHIQDGELDIFIFKPEKNLSKNKKYDTTINNIFLIFLINTSIYIEETDPYIDEIYNMIKDCK
jgi:hypothetical protein